MVSVSTDSTEIIINMQHVIVTNAYKNGIYSQICSVPLTAISKVQDETELPEPSVAVYVTLVLPMGKASPESMLDDRVTEPELSEAVGGVQVTIAVATPVSVVTAWDGGQPLIAGFSLSREIGGKFRMTLKNE